MDTARFPGSHRDSSPVRSTLTSVGWIGYIIIGAIAGWIAGKIVKGGGSGILMNIVIGIVGALIGGFLLSFFLNTAARRLVVHPVHRGPGRGDPALDRQPGAKGLVSATSDHA